MKINKKIRVVCALMYILSPIFMYAQSEPQPYYIQVVDTNPHHYPVSNSTYYSAPYTQVAVVANPVSVPPTVVTQAPQLPRTGGGGKAIMTASRNILNKIAVASMRDRILMISFGLLFAVVSLLILIPIVDRIVTKLRTKNNVLQL